MRNAFSERRRSGLQSWTAVLILRIAVHVLYCMWGVGLVSGCRLAMHVVLGTTDRNGIKQGLFDTQLICKTAVQ